MTLPTGIIYMTQVNVELGRPETAYITLDDGSVRALSGFTSGAIDMNSLRGKSAYTNMTGSGTGFYSTGQASTTQSFTAGDEMRVSVQNGKAPYSYSWSFQAANGCSMGTNGMSTVFISRTIPRFGYTGNCVVQCVITDSTGRTLTIQNIEGVFDWQTNQ